MAVLNNYVKGLYIRSSLFLFFLHHFAPSLAPHIIDLTKTAIHAQMQFSTGPQEKQAIMTHKPAKTDPKDRRNHARQACSLKVGYATMDLSFIDFITDINCWGVFIQSDKNVPVGESVSMTIPLHGDEQSIKIIGEVMWSGPQGLGVKFNMGVSTTVLNSLLK